MKDIKLNTLARYGTAITCAILAIILAGTWFIQYPETITTAARMTGTNAPKPIVPKQNLRLTRLLVGNNQEVRAGEVIGVLESTADYEEVQHFEHIVSEAEQAFLHNNTAAVKNLMQTPFQSLGELQVDYQALMQAYLPYRDYVLGDYISRKKALLQKDLSITQRSKSVLNEQRSLQEQDLNLAQTTIDKNKRLLDEKLISEQEYRELSSQYIGKQMTEPQMKSSYIGNESQTNAINKELVELDNQALTHQSLFQQAILQAKNRITAWKQIYLLTASTSGKLVFTSFLQENQNLDAGEAIAHIVPPHSNMYLETLIPQPSFGKVEVGQKVILKFDAFPWQQFGTVTGQVNYISPVPNDSGYYLAKVKLPNNLQTNYKKSIPFIEGLIANSEIITKDLSLAESLYYDLVKTIKK